MKDTENIFLSSFIISICPFLSMQPVMKIVNYSMRDV